LIVNIKGRLFHHTVSIHVRNSYIYIEYRLNKIYDVNITNKTNPLPHPPLFWSCSRRNARVRTAPTRTRRMVLPCRQIRGSHRALQTQRQTPVLLTCCRRNQFVILVVAGFVMFAMLTSMI